MTIEPERLARQPDELRPLTVPVVGDRPTFRQWRRARWLLNLPVGILAALTILAIFAPLIAPYSPVTPDVAHKLLPPSGAHWLGTDPLGMDVFSRVIYATRVDLSVAAGSVLLGIAIGAPLGALAGYQGGWLDPALGRFTEMIQAFPVILIAMLVLAAAGNNLVTLTVLLGVLNAPVYLKMVRSVAMPLREAEFIQAARCSGHKGVSLLWKHILPNTLVPIFSQFSISCAFAIQLIAGLSFIGLGVRVPEPEWGSMINEGANYIVFGQWWPSVFPGLAVFIAAFALTNLGNRLRRAALDEQG
jgi:peptide/nickel transport system permease protein